VPPADVLVPVVPLPHHAVDALALELAECIHDRLGEQRRRHIRINLCRDIWFRHDLIDDVEAFQLARGQLQLGRDFCSPRGVAIEDRRGPLGCDDLVNRTVQHEHPIRDRYGECPATAALANYC
jgi:hypothetical protein